MRQYQVELTAYNPLWRDVAENALMLADYANGFKFPFDIKNNGTRFAARSPSSGFEIVGDVPSPIRAVFKGGSGKRPNLTNVVTGEHILVEVELAANEELTICTDYGNKIVEVKLANGTIVNANHLISNDSSFFSLPVGNNKLTF